MQLFQGRGPGAVVALAIVCGSSVVHAEETPEPARVPLGEMGVWAGGSHSPEYMNAAGGTSGAVTPIGLGLRADISVLGWLLPVFVDMGPLRIGDFVGLDLGFDYTAALSGHWVIGGQLTYELSTSLGLGARLYSLTIFDGALDSHENFIVAEASARVERVIGRVRFSVKNAGIGAADVSDYGASLRFPTSWKIMDYSGWQVGADLDYIKYNDASYGGAKLFRVSGVLALGI